MKNFKLIVGSGLCLLALFFVSIGLRDKPQTYGSVSQGNEYHSTTTNSTWDIVSTKMVGASTVTLGSVIITNATAGASFEIRDATSTTDISSTTVAKISSTATSGTYIFDAVLLRGLSVLMSVGNIASTTITYR